MTEYTEPTVGATLQEMVSNPQSRTGRFVKGVLWGLKVSPLPIHIFPRVYEQEADEDRIKTILTEKRMEAHGGLIGLATGLGLQVALYIEMWGNVIASSDLNLFSPYIPEELYPGIAAFPIITNVASKFKLAYDAAKWRVPVKDNP